MGSVIVHFIGFWMFISSNGGLTAGRKNSEFALFPYYTDDKVTESSDSTGSKTIFQVQKYGEGRNQSAHYNEVGNFQWKFTYFLVYFYFILIFPFIILLILQFKYLSDHSLCHPVLFTLS